MSLGLLEINDIFAQCVSAIIVNLDDGTIVAATPPADILFGYMQGELVSKNIKDLIPTRFHRQHDEHLLAYSKNPAIRPMGVAQTDNLVGRRYDGREFRLAISLHPRVIGGHRCAVATIQAIAPPVLPTELATA